jgi:TetR/AcrR family transcriptional regulator
MSSQKTKGKQRDTIPRILNTAAAVFAESGFAGARMDEIADRAGVNKATIYYHIGGKETLYTRVLHEHFASAGDRFDQILQQAESPEEKLSLYIQHIAQVMDQDPHKAVMMLRELAGGGVNFPDIVAQDLAAIVNKLAGILAEGENQGRFIHVNPISVHFLVIGALIFYKVGTPIREKFTEISESLRSMNTNESGKFVDEIEHLVLRSLRQ